jgi:hypothetical protein
VRRFPLLLLLLFTPACVRADPVEFSYSFTASPGYISASGYDSISVKTSASPDGSTLSFKYGGSRLVLALASGTDTATPGDAGAFGASTTIPIGTFTFTPAANPRGSFSFDSYPTLTLALTDNASKQSTTMTLYADFGGDTSPSGGGYVEDGTYGAPLLLGNHAYNVFASTSVVLPDDNGALSGTLYAQVSVSTPADAITTTSAPPIQAPEPSGLLLAGTALSLLTLRRLRRAR